jgi:FMN phosphatase YigB (HAD superfamily)
MGSQKIRAVIFDLDDTLFDCTGLLTEPARERAADVLALRIPHMSRNQLLERQIALSDECGSIGAINALGQEHGLPRIDIEKALEAYNRPEVESIRPFSDTQSTLEALRNRGVQMLVVTSGRPQRQKQKVQSLGLDSFFNEDSGTIFYHDDLLNPCKDSTLRSALSHLDIPPDEVLSVGDKLDSEIAASNRLGMVTARMLHGRQKALEPTDSDQRADHEINHLSDLLNLI